MTKSVFWDLIYDSGNKKETQKSGSDLLHLDELNEQFASIGKFLRLMLLETNFSSTRNRIERKTFIDQRGLSKTGKTLQKKEKLKKF